MALTGVSVKYLDTSSGLFKEVCPVYKSVSFTNTLNEYGEFEFTYPLTQDKADFLTIRNQIEIQANNEFFAGYITETEKILTDEVPIVRIKGVSLLDDFVNTVFIPNVMIPNELITDLLDPSFPGTIIKPSNWLTTVEASSATLNYLVSMQTTMEVFQVLREQSGFNFRYIGTSASPRQVEFGKFGLLKSLKIRRNPDTRYCPPGVAIIETLSELEEALDLYNRVYPMGGADDNGINQLTLRDAIGSSYEDPSYPITSDVSIPNTDASYNSSVFANVRTAPNTFAAYYIEDPISVGVYGQLMRAKVFKDLQPFTANSTDFTDADRQRASGELYLKALEDLKAHAYPQKTYKLTLFGDLSNVLPGDKIALKYTGWVDKYCRDGRTERVYADIDSQFTLASKRTTIDDNGVVKTETELSNTFKVFQTNTDFLLNTSKTIKDYERQRKGSVNNFNFNTQGNVSAGVSFKAIFTVPQNQVYANAMKLRIKVSPYRASTITGVVEDLVFPTDLKVFIDGTDYSGLIVLTAFGDYPATTTSYFDILDFAEQLGQLTAITAQGQHLIEVTTSLGNAYLQLQMEVQSYLNSR